MINIIVAIVPRGTIIATNVGVVIIIDCVNKIIGNARCARTKKFEIASMTSKCTKTKKLEIASVKNRCAKILQNMTNGCARWNASIMRTLWTITGTHAQTVVVTLYWTG